MTSPLEPDRGDLARFIDVMFDGADPASFVGLRGFPDDREAPALFTDSAAAGAPDLLDQAIAAARRAARHDTPAVFAPPIATFSVSGRARRADLVNGLALSVECDANPAASLARLTAVLGPPTFVVESGGLWVDDLMGETLPKIHAHWKLATPTRDEAGHEALRRLRQLACDYVGADATSISIVHPMRWPGSWHRKAAPRLARIVQDNDTRIELFAALAAFEAIPPEQFARQRDAKTGTSNPEKIADTADVAAAVTVIPNADLDWDDWNRVGMAIWAATGGDAHDGFVIFDEWSQKSDKYDADLTEARWDHYSTSPPEQLGAGTLFHMARRRSPGWEIPSRSGEAVVDRWFEAVAESTSLFPDDPADMVAASSTSEFFELLTVRELFRRPKPKFLVDRHIPETSLGFVYGAPGGGKSFLVLDIALHLAYGRDEWHGDAVRQKDRGKVIYLTGGEGVSGLSQRIKAWMRQNGCEDEPDRLLLVPEAVNFLNDDEMAKLAATLRQAHVGPVSLIVVDTISRAMPGADENLQKEMTQFVRNCDRLKTTFQCSVLGVHHCGKNGDMRGSTVLLGAGDYVFKLERAKAARVGAFTCEKQKDAPDGWTENYAFDVFDIGDGESSLTVMRTETFEHQDAELTTDLTTEILAAMQKAWDAGIPWRLSQKAKADRATLIMARDFRLSAEAAAESLKVWMASGIVVEAVFDTRNKKLALRPVARQLEAAE